MRSEKEKNKKIVVFLLTKIVANHEKEFDFR